MAGCDRLGGSAILKGPNSSSSSVLLMVVLLLRTGAGVESGGAVDSVIGGESGRVCCGGGGCGLGTSPIASPKKSKAALLELEEVELEVVVFLVSMLSKKLRSKGSIPPPPPLVEAGGDVVEELPLKGSKGDPVAVGIGKRISPLSPEEPRREVGGFLGTSARLGIVGILNAGGSVDG